jgi:hypothetical protein
MEEVRPLMSILGGESEIIEHPLSHNEERLPHQIYEEIGEGLPHQLPQLTPSARITEHLVRIYDPVSFFLFC